MVLQKGNIHKMNNSYSIKDILSLLLGKIWLLIIVTILGGAIAYSYSKFVMPLKYSSHISMYVQSYTGISENANAQNNISNSKQLVNTYIEVLKDDAVMNAVAELLEKEFDHEVLKENFSYSDGKITPSSIRGCIKISSVQDTSAVKIVSTSKNAEVSAAICNDLAEVAPEYVEKAVGVGSINTIDEAKIYNTPVAPNKTKNTAIGAAAALLLTVLIVFIIDFFDNTIKETSVLAEKFKKPIIGGIQQFNTDKKKKAQDEKQYVKLTDKDVPFTIVESYKSIRTNITFALSTVDRKIFAVSSPNPCEGKSTTSANIAIALAQGGNKVLLIDADMRKAVQHKIFGLRNKKGLSSVISKMSKLEECIQKNVMENLDVMTAGPVPPNPSELLASDSMGAILDKLNEEYSMILLDTPPINVVTDAMELAKNTSGIVTVLRYGKTTDDDVEEAIKKIEFAQMNMLGFIMNDVKIKHGGYYSKYKYKDEYYYKKSYDLSSDDKSETDEDDVSEKETAKTNNKSSSGSKDKKRGKE